MTGCVKRRWTAVLVGLAIGGRSRSLFTLEGEFGSRWSQLSAALAKPKRYAAWANPFASGAETPFINLKHFFPAFYSCSEEGYILSKRKRCLQGEKQQVNASSLQTGVAVFLGFYRCLSTRMSFWQLTVSKSFLEQLEPHIFGSPVKISGFPSLRPVQRQD